MNGGNALDAIEVDVGASLTLPTPTKEGFQFKGWYKNSVLLGLPVTSPYTPSGNVTLYAKWETPKYAVTLNYGAAGIANQILEIEMGKSIELDNPTADGFEFAGWFLNDNFEGEAVTFPFTPNGDVTLFAKWTVVETAERYFVFTPDSTGNSVSVKASNVTPYPETIVIPAEYNGKPVTSVEKSGFSNKTSLRSVVLPEGITHIYNLAFRGCNSLASITIPKSLKQVTLAAFDTTYQGRKVYYNGTIQDWCGITFNELMSQPLYYYGHLYIGNSLVTEVTVPESVTELSDYAFATSSITKVTLPSGLKKIGRRAFGWCKKLKELNLPDSIEIIEQDAFSDTTIPITEDGVKYVGKWVVGYDKDTLSGAVRFKEGTMGFAESSMSGCVAMTEAVIPDSTQHFGRTAFSGCNKMEKLTIGSKKLNFGYNAFVNCSGLKEFYYTGTLADWCALKIEGGDEPTPISQAGAMPLFYIAGEPIVDLVIPETITAINKMAFMGYLGLKSVVIPNSVTVMESQVFLYCENLTDIYCEATAKLAKWHVNWHGDNKTKVHWGSEWEYVDGVPTLKNA